MELILRVTTTNYNTRLNTHSEPGWSQNFYLAALIWMFSWECIMTRSSLLMRSIEGSSLSDSLRHLMIKNLLGNA